MGHWSGCCRHVGDWAVVKAVAASEGGYLPSDSGERGETRAERESAALLQPLDSRRQGALAGQSRRQLPQGWIWGDRRQIHVHAGVDMARKYA